ncbi:DNA-binding transcriptional MocR family regulator [Pedobacter cryoconitis]|uniref:HTH-type transcriptional regulator NorG n=1 Tax=Pedobacter cryoconitis TaxID=188932 RepID=A0A7W9DX54_9SPHI|nr:PLP-dependent aminotransferase family protein [Pedobacter cryoconitis]MBB5634508.1 DNA-binding transcriptional MocR family regulator [Pedobacter cryoconitis]
MRNPEQQRNTYLYETIAGNLTHQILSGVLISGDKLPSIREICQQYKVSMSTALQAYYLLESKSLIRSVPKSGYYVCYINPTNALPNKSNPSLYLGNEDTSNIVSKVYDSISSDHIMLSLGVPAAELLPLSKLNKAFSHTLHHHAAHGSGYEHVMGNPKLRRQIARLSANWDGKLTENDIMTTAGCTGAMLQAIIALTKRGDTIAIESPVYFGILQLALSLGLKVLELPTHPETGIEIDALKIALSKNKVKLCLLISNFSNPMGGTIPSENKKEIVRLIEHYQIPLIENDMYGDLYFGTERPENCKTYDESGLVLLCSSFSKTLAPGYRVGWLTPGKFAEQIRRVKFATAISSTTLTQEAVACFLEKGRYESHLKKLRITLNNNCLNYMEAISNYFPKGTKISRPQGGFMLWVELDPKINTAGLYDKTIKMKISIAPGRMFTLQNQYNNCLRLSYGLPWTNQINNAIKTIGNLIR